MDSEDLQECANEAFAAIAENTGLKYPHSTIEEAFNSFREISSTNGVAWLIDAATGTGMSHIGWSAWMGEVRKILNLTGA